MNSKIATKAEIVVSGFAGLLACATLFYVFASLGASFDFTDESYYLVSIADYDAFRFTVTQFGFVYHWLYVLVGGSIALLRAVNLALTIGLSFWLSYLVLRPVGLVEPKSLTERFCRIGLALALASTSLATLNAWLPTPNYNGLALQALLIVAIGLLTAQRSFDGKSALGWVLIGFGGWLAFMAKPTTALLIAPLALLYLAFSGKLRFNFLGIAIAVACTLLLVAMLALDGSSQAFIERLMVGLQDGTVLDGGHSASGIVRWDSWQLLSQHNLVFWSVCFAIILIASLCLARDQRLAICGLFITLLAAVSFLAWLPNNVATFTINDVRSIGTLSVGILLACLVVSVFAYFRTSPRPPKAGVSVVVFALFPFALSFGSNVNYWGLGLVAMLFWILAGVLLIRSVSSNQVDFRAIIPAILAAQCLVIFLLGVWMEKPYRQPEPVRLQTAEIEIGREGSQLKVSADFARYIAELRKLTTSNGFQPGDPMLDLTGHFPGSIFAIGATAVGEAWMVGGYRGSEALALRVLARTSCEIIARAWILTEPNGTRALPFSVVGAPETAYSKVGELTSPGGPRSKKFEHIILRPNAPGEIQALCENARRAAS
jgi:hypothetical protein